MGTPQIYCFQVSINTKVLSNSYAFWLHAVILICHNSSMSEIEIHWNSKKCQYFWNFNTSEIPIARIPIMSMLQNSKMLDILMHQYFQYIVTLHYNTLEIPVDQKFQYVGNSDILEILIIIIHQNLQYVRKCDMLKFQYIKILKISVCQKIWYIGNPDVSENSNNYNMSEILIC